MRLAFGRTHYYCDNDIQYYIILSIVNYTFTDILCPFRTYLFPLKALLYIEL